MGEGGSAGRKGGALWRLAQAKVAKDIVKRARRPDDVRHAADHRGTSPPVDAWLQQTLDR